MHDIGFYITGGTYADRVASNRYRIGIPIEYLKKEGVSSGLGKVLVTVIGKGEKSPSDVIQASRQKGHKVIADICDIYQEPYQDRFSTEYLIRESDAVVCATETIRDYIQDRFKYVRAFVIPDPYEFPEVEPDMPCNGQKLLWYGHQSNYSAFQDIAPKLRGLLTVCTNLPGTHYPWSFYNVLQGLAWCDLVVLPTKKDTVDDCPIPKYKGANRLVEAVRRGRYVITDTTVDSYKGYGMWRGDVLEGIEWAREHPVEALDQVRKAQSIVREKHDPKVIANQWLNVCREVGGSIWRLTGRTRD